MTPPRHFPRASGRLAGAILVSPSQATFRVRANGRNESLPGETRQPYDELSLFLCRPDDPPALRHASSRATVRGNRRTCHSAGFQRRRIVGNDDHRNPGVRIVRLSQVTGEVQLDRQTGRGFEGAFANLPITQGGKLRTGTGVAEVEFEDNSSLRLTPNSIVEFPVLSMSSDGTRASTIHVLQGTIFVSLTKGKANNNVNVTFGKETLALGPAAHIELALNGTQPRLDVLDGTVQAVSGATTTTVGRKKALLFDPANSSCAHLGQQERKG